MSQAVRQARRETEEASKILDALLHDAPVGLAFIDRDLRIVRINPTLAAINGGSPQDQVGRTMAEVVADLWPTLEPAYHRVLGEERPVLNLEIRGPTAEDPSASHDWLANLYPVRTDGTVIGIGVVAVDISDRKRLEGAGIDLTDAVVGALAATNEAPDPLHRRTSVPGVPDRHRDRRRTRLRRRHRERNRACGSHPRHRQGRDPR